MKRHTIERLLAGAILATAMLAFPVTAYAGGKEGKWGPPNGPVQHTNQDEVPPDPPDPPEPPPGGQYRGPGIDLGLFNLFFGRYLFNPFSGVIVPIKPAPVPPPPPPPRPGSRFGEKIG
ncbi:MAG: hypothetical protein ACYTGP_02430 [Planctomycetota bacterium]